MVAVTCAACKTMREASDDELRARTVAPCACGNGSYHGIDWRTYTPPEPEAAPTEEPTAPTEPEVP